MGSFGGHALPGSFFIIVGLYWTVQFYRKFFDSMRNGGRPFYATATFNCDCCCSSDDDYSSSTKLSRSTAVRQPRCRCCRSTCSMVDWEGVAKMFFSTVGFFVEVINAMFHTGRFPGFGGGQHATMFFFFGISGLVDNLVKLGSPLLPRGSEYFFGALAFVVEALLFMFHLHGRSSMDVLVHTLLVYVLYATIIVILLEAKFRRKPLLVFVRAFLLIIQGTWFWQVGFILYKPLPGSEPWEQENHQHIMVITLMFIWHIIGVLTIMITIGGSVYLTCYRRRLAVSKSIASGNGHHRMHLLPSTNSSAGIIYYDDENDDDDFDITDGETKKIQQQP